MSPVAKLQHMGTLSRGKGHSIKDPELPDYMEIPEDEFIEIMTTAQEQWEQLLPVYVSRNIKKMEQLKDEGFQETKTIRLLRINFWNEMAIARKTGTNVFLMYNVFTGVCSKYDFVQLLKDKDFCHYLLNPCADYSLELADILADHGLKFYESILAMGDQHEYFDKDGNQYSERLSFNDKMRVLNLKFNIIKRLEDRIYGEATKKIEANIKASIENKTPKYIDKIKQIYGSESHNILNAVQKRLNDIGEALPNKGEENENS